jgi:hypothetical protein
MPARESSGKLESALHRYGRSQTALRSAVARIVIDELTGK